MSVLSLQYYNMSQPPVLQVEPVSTPSREWAESTASALQTDQAIHQVEVNESKAYVDSLDNRAPAPAGHAAPLTTDEQVAAQVGPVVVKPLVLPKAPSDTTTPGYELPGAFPQDKSPLYCFHP